jgi:hypothetical protein
LDVIRRRLIPLALVVTVLLAVVAVVAGGRPLGSGKGSGRGLPTSFWDFAFTTLAIVEVALFIIGVAAIVVFRRERTAMKRPQRNTIRTLAILIGGTALLMLVVRHLNLHHLLHSQSATHNPTKTPGVPASGGKSGSTTQHVHFRWEELVVVLGLLLGVGVLAAATRSRLGQGAGPRRAAPEVLAAALDQSLDDLRSDPDLRRAIIAAYARMETALAAAGLPRQPAEAPLEYVERALLTLDTSAAAVHRLTDLFEWARFSQHEPKPPMRDEAVDALVAVRDELRASELVPA